jgi:hypothetical protein
MGCVTRAGGRRLWLIVVLSVATSGAAVETASAARCGANPVCPYQRAQQLGGSDYASLSGPLGIAIAASGNVVVADWPKQSVRLFSPFGHLIEQVGRPGQFNELSAVAAKPAGGEIYAADLGCVYWFAADGAPDGRWCLHQSGPDRSIASLAASPTGIVYAETTDDTIHVLDAAHAQIGSWSAAAGPYIAADGDGHVYVANNTNSTVWVYSSSGVPDDQIDTYRALATPTGLAAWGDTVYVEGEELPPYWQSMVVAAYDPAGDPLGSPIKVPVGQDPPGLGGLENITIGPLLAAGPLGVDVVTGNDDQVTGYRSSLIRTDQWGTLAPDDFTPAAALTDDAGDIYVVDSGPLQSRVIEYEPGRRRPFTLANLGFTEAGEGVEGETSAAFGPKGEIVVCDDDGAEGIIRETQGVGVTSIPRFCEGAVAVSAGGALHSVVSEVNPSAVGIEPDGDTYFAPGGNVLVEDTDRGHRLHRWPLAGVPAGDTPVWLATDARGDMFIALAPASGAPGGAINVYRRSGDLLASWPYAHGRPGQIAVAPNGSNVVVTPSVELEDELGQPTGIGPGGDTPPYQVTVYSGFGRPASRRNSRPAIMAVR